MAFDPEDDEKQEPYCHICGEAFVCQECGFEVDGTGECQRFESEGIEEDQRRCHDGGGHVLTARHPQTECRFYPT